jgi:Tubulin folding cofactor D C terminal
MLLGTSFHFVVHAHLSLSNTSLFVCLYQVATVSYPKLVKLLLIGSYSQHVLSGLVISTGGLQESLRKVALEALIEYLKASAEGDAGKNKEHMLSNDFVWLFQQHKKCDRVIIPAYKVPDFFQISVISIFKSIRKLHIIYPYKTCK